MPVQRIPRYNLLLADLCKKTDDSHPDAANLKKALAMTKEISESINSSMTRAANQMKIMEIQNSFVNKCPNLMEAHRVYIYEGEVIKFTNRFIVHCKFYLFNDILLYSHRILNSNKYRYKGLIDLGDATIQALEDTETTKNGFSINSSDKIYTVCTKARDQREKWISVLQDAITKWNTINVGRKQKSKKLRPVSNLMSELRKNLHLKSPVDPSKLTNLTKKTENKTNTNVEFAKKAAVAQGYAVEDEEELDNEDNEDEMEEDQPEFENDELSPMTASVVGLPQNSPKASTPSTTRTNSSSSTISSSTHVLLNANSLDSLFDRSSPKNSAYIVSTPSSPSGSTILQHAGSGSQLLQSTTPRDTIKPPIPSRSRKPTSGDSVKSGTESTKSADNLMADLNKPKNKQLIRPNLVALQQPDKTEDEPALNVDKKEDKKFDDIKKVSSLNGKPEAAPVSERKVTTNFQVTSKEERKNITCTSENRRKKNTPCTSKSGREKR